MAELKVLWFIKLQLWFNKVIALFTSSLSKLIRLSVKNRELLTTQHRLEEKIAFKRFIRFETRRINRHIERGAREGKTWVVFVYWPANEVELKAIRTLIGYFTKRGYNVFSRSLRDIHPTELTARHKVVLKVKWTDYDKN